MEITIRPAGAEPLLTQVRELFCEYRDSLEVDLCFQDFEQELSDLPGKYAPPEGRLYLVFAGGSPAACGALRPFRKDRCEMKRLYVRPQFRGHNLGKLLAGRLIADAKKTGYRQMLLDTLPSMTAAQALYRALGFREIPSYRFNPVEGTRYLCLDLQSLG